MVNDYRFHIVFATSSVTMAIRLVDSIEVCLPSSNLSFSTLLIGCTSRSKLDLPEKITCIGCYEEYLPIVQSRNYCQDFLKKRMRSDFDVGLVLDDDLLWIMPEIEFFDLIGELLSKGCDMAFSSLSGDPPIPKEYVRASPLLDVLLNIFDGDEKVGCILSDFVSTVEVGCSHEGIDFPYHDNYAFDKNNFYKKTVDINGMDWDEFFLRLSKGKTTTRSVSAPKTIEVATGRDRGGATIVLNSDVLKYKNNSIFVGEWVSRRSDMVMAMLAEKSGYFLCRTPPILHHKREDSFDTHSPKKLIGDVLGVAFVASLFGDDDFEFRFFDRLERVVVIIKETNCMLMIIKEWLEVKGLLTPVSSKLIGGMVKENNVTVNAVRSEVFLDVCFPDMSKMYPLMTCFGEAV